MQKQRKQDKVLIKYFKVLSAIGITFIAGICITFIFPYAMGLLVLVPIVTYLWVNDSKKGKFFYSVLSVILMFSFFLLYLFIILSAWGRG